MDIFTINPMDIFMVSETGNFHLVVSINLNGDWSETLTNLASYHVYVSFKGRPRAGSSVASKERLGPGDDARGLFMGGV